MNKSKFNLKLTHSYGFNRIYSWIYFLKNNLNFRIKVFLFSDSFFIEKICSRTSEMFCSKAIIKWNLFSKKMSFVNFFLNKHLCPFCDSVVYYLFWNGIPFFQIQICSTILSFRCLHSDFAFFFQTKSLYDQTMAMQIIKIFTKDYSNKISILQNKFF